MPLAAAVAARRSGRLAPRLLPAGEEENNRSSSPGNDALGQSRRVATAKRPLDFVAGSADKGPTGSLTSARSLSNDGDVGKKCGLLNQRPTLVRLTANGSQGCNKHGGEEFESKRAPVRGLLASTETISSVPRIILICNRPHGR